MEEIKRKGWFQRNWMWVLPVGGCLTLMLFVVLIAGTVIFGISKMFSNSTPYGYAFEEASINSEVIAILGTPIKKT
jgi:hypothetical protein